MKYKAKTLTGEWVEGDLFNATSGMTIIENGGSDPKDFHFISPSTLCQQVRGTDFFEGDIVKCWIAHPTTNEVEIHECEVYWSELDLKWLFKSLDVDMFFSWIEIFKTEHTGKNKFD